MAQLYFILVASWYCREQYKAIVNKTIRVYTYMWAINLVGENFINHTALLHSTAWKPGGVWGGDQSHVITISLTTLPELMINPQVM